MVGSSSVPEFQMEEAGLVELKRQTQRSASTAGGGVHMPLRMLTAPQCATRSPQPYIVKGLIVAGNLAVMFGQPSAGKSSLAPLIAHAVAQGRPVFDRRVRQGNVLYIAAEDRCGVHGRTDALCRRFGTPDGYRVLEDDVSLDIAREGDPPDLLRIIEAADRIGASLIVIDTMSCFFSSLDENDSRGMTRAVKLLRRLCTPSRAVLLVHHAAKSGQQNEGGMTPRGHGVLNAAADVTLRVEAPSGSRPGTISLGKNRNGPSSAKFHFRIVSEFLGTDDEGDPITAPIAEEILAGSAANDNLPTGSQGRVSAQARRAADILRDLANTVEPKSAVPDHFPGVQNAVPVQLDAWRAACNAAKLSSSEERRARDQAFQRAKDNLLAAGQIERRAHGGIEYVWLRSDMGT